MPGGSSGRFGRWGQNPNWGGGKRMPDWMLRGPGGQQVSRTRTQIGRYQGYDERNYWEEEIRRLEDQLRRLLGSGVSDTRAVASLKQRIRNARLELARSPQRETGGGETGYGDSGLNLSQTQEQGEEQDGGMTPDEYLDWMDQFMKRSAGWRSKYGNTAELPAAWTPDDAGGAKAQMDPMAVIRSAQPRLQEEMNRAFGSAAQRLGAAGVPLSSSSYTKELGKGARKATTDLAEIMNKYLFESSESQAARDQEARQSALDRSLSAWGTRGGWQMDQGQQWESQWPQLLQMFAGMMPGISWR